MVDQYGRNIDYMRISVTDRCNLQCIYCVPQKGLCTMKQEELLTKEEILRLVHHFAHLGIKKIKITGGEPLIYQGITNLIKEIKAVNGIDEVTMTTNGILLEQMAEDLIDAGLDGINISLDTLDRSKYEKITRHDSIDQVLRGFHKVIELPIKTKINCVPIGNFNENELVQIARLAKEYKTDVRFIELMPMGFGKHFKRISYETVKKILEQSLGKGEYSNLKHGNGPAKYYNYENFLGSIGFISAVSDEFCESCSRVRLTADGKLKLCLHYNYGIDLKSLLRSEISEDELKTRIRKAIYRKPNRHCFNQPMEKEDEKETEQRNMIQIGG